MISPGYDMPVETTHWNAHAARWALLGAPLRPAPADIQYLNDSVRRLAGTEPPSSALLLGVTPEIAEMNWDRPLRLLAVDKSVAMVQSVWPGDTPLRRALVGDWLSLAPPESPFDLAVGDGVFSMFDYPVGYASLATALGRLVKVGGLLSLRLFCRVEPSEPVDQVFRELFERRIGSFHVFKWRLAMALQGDGTHGVRLHDIWSTFTRHAISPRHVAEQTGWPEAVVATIEGYRDVDDRYSFSTENEVVECLEAFELLETWRPPYELGERCPHLTFRRRSP